MKLLLTGGSGFVGRNILPILNERYEVYAPTHSECDLADQISVKRYVEKVRPELLVHCAIGDPAKGSARGIAVDVLSSFLTITQYPFEKVVYIGSGAEFDKSKEICNVSEDALGNNVPTDEYGLAKYTLNTIARASKNIFNARIFGCYGPGEPERRFIRHAIDCCFKRQPITIRRDCRFSYVFVDDLGRAIVKILESIPQNHDYNICGDGSYLLTELAEEVRRLANVNVPIELLAEGFANEYSCDGGAFAREFDDFKFTAIEEGIAKELDWMRGISK